MSDGENTSNTTKNIAREGEDPYRRSCVPDSARPVRTA
jgi:hypothetical protein